MAAANPVMAKINPPRTVETFDFDRFKRQFYQWYYIEKMSLPVVKQNFDHLFDDVFRMIGFKFEFSENQWAGRLRKWNKVWGLKNGRNGGQVLLPDDCKNLQLWREWDKQGWPLSTCTPVSCGSHQASHIHIAKSDLPEHSASGNSDSHTSASDLAHHSYFTCLTCSANENSNSGRAAHASDPTYHTALTGQVPWSYNGHATFPELEEAHGKLGSSSFPPLTANFPALESGSRFADEHQQNQLHFHHGGQILSTPSPSTWNNGSSGDGSLDDNATGCGVIFNDAFGEFTHGNDSTFPS